MCILQLRCISCEKKRIFAHKKSLVAYNDAFNSEFFFIHCSFKKKSLSVLSAPFAIVNAEKRNKLNDQQNFTQQIVFRSTRNYCIHSIKHEYTQTYLFIHILTIVYLIFVRKKFYSTFLSAYTHNTEGGIKGRKGK